MLSPQKAADRAGVSRKTIMDAITSQKLHAIRDNRNRWQIAEDDLERWMEGRTDRKISPPTTDTSSDTIRLEEQLKSALKEAGMYREQLEKSEAEKERLMDLLKEAQRRRSWLEILTGKRPV